MLFTNNVHFHSPNICMSSIIVCLMCSLRHVETWSPTFCIIMLYVSLPWGCIQLDFLHNICKHLRSLDPWYHWWFMIIVRITLYNKKIIVACPHILPINRKNNSEEKNYGNRPALLATGNEWTVTRQTCSLAKVAILSTPNKINSVFLKMAYGPHKWVIILLSWLVHLLFPSNNRFLCPAYLWVTPVLCDWLIAMNCHTGFPSCTLSYSYCHSIPITLQH